jgi:preprotein translocase subunit SecA
VSGSGTSSMASNATMDLMPPAVTPERRSGYRFGPRWLLHLRALCGPPSRRRLARAALQIDLVRYWEGELSRESDDELRERGRRLRGRARGRGALDRLLSEAFGAMCVASQRRLGLRPFDVQIAAGVVLHHGAIAELATGEGKTLAASLPTFLNALPGKGAHVATVNDYLARRDAEWLGPVYQALGLSVGTLQSQMEDLDRAAAYRCDITYGTASDFGFDFLRDRLKVRGGRQEETDPLAPWKLRGTQTALPDARVQRGHHFALVDEADNVFIDEARTPLVISTGGTQPADPEDLVVYEWADQLARRLIRGEHFLLDEKKQKLELTREGKRLARWSNPPSGPGTPRLDKLYEHLERSLHAHHRLDRDQHYLVEEGKIVLIDESTGRRTPDRHWSDGIHQAVETKEGVPINKGGQDAARITYQAYFRLYTRLAGMTGTAAENARELRRVYKLRVVRVPTNRPIIREQWPDRVHSSEQAKFEAVVEEVARLCAFGRPVLIGTGSVERSERLSEQLSGAGIEHQVLNARYHEQEAQIITRAGEGGRVTIATNMAGRGTDIKLGPGVAAAGGLHVIITEKHEAGRIDRQLAGRAGRQGDPGSCQLFLSLEDEILEALGLRRWHNVAQSAATSSGELQRYAWVFQHAQQRLEKRHYWQRVDLMLYEQRRLEIFKDLGADPYVD